MSVVCAQPTQDYVKLWKNYKKMYITLGLVYPNVAKFWIFNTVFVLRATLLHVKKCNKKNGVPIFLPNFHRLYV